MRNLLRFFINTFLISAIASSVTMETKIIGGEPVGFDRFPSAVQFFNNGNLCAGTILNSWTVLTAAHCFDVNKKVSEMVVQVGARYLYDYRAEVYDVLSYVAHENYNKFASFSCDIGLLFLTDPIKFSNKTKKAIIVNNGKWMKNTEKSFAATGWGWTKYDGPVSEQGLLMTHLEYVSSQDCGRMHGLELTPDMFCLYGGGDKDTCRGDSGGGIMWNNMVVGITSHGDGCAKKNKPSVYTNVWYFREWIRTQVIKFVNDYCKKSKEKKKQK